MTVPSPHTGTLVIVRTPGPDDWREVLSELTSSGRGSIVLIQDAVTATQMSADSVQVLKEDLDHRGLSSPFSPITYDGLLDRIFAADKVIVL